MSVNRGPAWLAAAALLATPAAAQSFNLDFGVGMGTPAASYGGAAGQVGHWNEIPLTAAPQPLLDLSGAPTSVTLQLGFTPGYYSPSNQVGNLGPTGDDAALLNDYFLLDVDGAWVAPIFSGLQPGVYAIYAYGLATEGSFLVNTITFLVSPIGGKFFAKCGNVDWPGWHLLDGSYATDATTVSTFLDVTAGGGVVGDSHYNGLQITYLGSTPQLFDPYCDQGVVDGCDPNVMASGRPVATLDEDFHVETFSTRSGRNGLHYFSTNGRAANPWGGVGLQCVTPPVQRTPVKAVVNHVGGGCGGSYGINFNEWMVQNPTKAPPPGATVQMQVWTYDPTNPGAQSLLLDAIEFTVEP
jgi:hypothetical protein